MMRWFFQALAVCSFALLGVFPTSGQAVDTAAAEARYPYNPIVEDQFTRGVTAFDRADYESALEAFKAVISAPENRRTTAAMLMAGRTLVVSERYGEAVGLLSAFVRNYPASRYAGAAEETLDLARRRYDLERDREDGVFVLGVLLPMSERAVRFTRSITEGIRMAVDRFNQRGGRQIRIVFEDSGANPDFAQAAFLRLLDRAHPGAVIGPLFSEEAVAVAEVADSMGVLLIVPLATDEAVSSEKKTVFQANPTYEARGRGMARYAVQRLRYSRLGVIADAGSYAERMARGFEDEAIELEAEVPLVALLAGVNEWYSIAESLVSGPLGDGEAGGVSPAFENVGLQDIDALYLPVTGENASGLALVGLDEIDDVNPQVRLLGNGEWAHIPEHDRMTQHNLVFATDFRVDSTRSEVIEFDQRFRSRMSRSPDQPAYVGYDVASFLIDRLRSVRSDEELVESFHESGEYRGFGIRLFFAEGQVNRSLFFTRYTDRGLRED